MKILSITPLYYEIVADERDLIEKSLIKMCDEYQCDLVVTTGGTGPALRDITPEATEKVCQKMLPSFGELMRMTSLKYVPTAILSRQSASIRNKSLIVNLPGKPKSIRECLEAVFPAIPYCVDLILGNYMQVNEKNIQAFRPKQ
ncbi:molybdopterin adenylyltransferase [Helicobacter pylori]